MVKKNKEEGEEGNGKSSTSFALYCEIESRNVLPLESGLSASEMMTRAV